MNLESALQAKQFVLVTARDEGKPVTAVCPGHRCKTHTVEIKRTDAGMCLTCSETRQFDEKKKVWTNVEQVCSGATFGVCYHILAVVLHITEKLGTVEFFHKKEEAEAKKAEGDKVFPIWSKDQERPEKFIWLVFTPKKTLGEVVGQPLRKPA